MTLAPGAVNIGGGGQRDLRFVGRGIDDSNYTFDGIDATGVQEQSQKASARLAIPLDSIAEFRVSSSVYTADQGGSAGAQVSVVSKTGTDVFHGSAFDSITDQWTSTGVNSQREDSGTFRFDQRFNEKTSLFVRVSIDDANINQPLDTVGGRDNPRIRPSNYVVQLTHVFSPTLVNELRGGINRSALHHFQFGTSPLSTDNGEPGTVAASVSVFDGPSTDSLDTEAGTTIDEYDDLSIVRGRHTIKMGIGVERHRLNNSSGGIASGTLTYSSPQNFVNNVLDDYFFAGQLTLGGHRRTYIMPYVQDTYKVRSNLTVTYGLRWEHYTVLKEVLGRQAVVKVSCGGFCPQGTPLFSPYYKDFAPRLGLAWLPGGPGGKTVIRTGFGMYFSPDQMDDFSDGHESTAERFDVSSSSVPNLSWPVFQSQLPAPSFSPKAWDPNRKDGYFENWDLAIQ